jgi:16S rRNA (guanine527-N7)-methyltransferase
VAGEAPREAAVPDDESALSDILPVSRETGDRLALLVRLIRKWQPAENLVSAATIPDIWRRHVADSAQLVPLFPDTRRWLDIGSGAGFPGLVIAIVGSPGTAVDLIESNQRKCAFLRLAARETGAPAVVHEGRAEGLLAAWKTPVDRIVSRATAPLGRLFAIAEPVMHQGVPAAFHKGQDFGWEIDETSKSWVYDLVRHESRVGGRGVILEITGLRRRP